MIMKLISISFLGPKKGAPIKGGAKNRLQYESTRETETMTKTEMEDML